MIFAKDLPADEKYPLSSVYWIYNEDKHTDPATGGYVGVCVKGTDHRLKRHLGDAKNGSGLPVHRAIRKYGDKIKVKTLILADPEFCLLLEEMLRPVTQMAGTWNIGSGGRGRMVGWVPSEETRKKIGAAHKGRVQSQESKDKRSAAQKGRKLSEEAKKKMSLASKGKSKNLTPAQVKRKSDAMKARGDWLTQEQRARIAESNRGRKASAETKAKQSAASKGKPKTSTHASNIAQALKGKAKTAEHNANNSAAQRAYYANISPWENYRACKPAWASAIEIVAKWTDDATITTGQMAKMFGLEKRSFVVSILRDFKAGWKPTEDSKFLAWLAGYNKQKELINESTCTT